MMDKQVIHLNNDYTKQKNSENKTSMPPRRRHLGLILIVAMVLFSLVSLSLVHAYQGFQKQLKLQQVVLQTNTELVKDNKIKSEEIKKLKDSDFLAKYARTQGYSETNEKVFEIPGMQNSNN
ncbi:MAG: septum formation initiator family protein [Lactococcus sp.]